MSATVEGGIKAAITNKLRHGEDYYIRLGALGGKKGKADGTIKEFAAMTPEKRREAGQKGGKISKRGKSR